MIDFSRSFHPIVGDQPGVLILGTLPGKESLRKQEYYGHPRNVFWRIIFDLFCGSYTECYDERIAFAKAHQISLWDVCHSAQRPGSLDSDISMVVANAIDELLDTYPSIEVVAFNGKKAAQLYDKYFTRRDAIVYYTMLSTSPANAAFSYDQKQDNWSQILL